MVGLSNWVVVVVERAGKGDATSTGLVTSVGDVEKTSVVIERETRENVVKVWEEDQIPSIHSVQPPPAQIAYLFVSMADWS